MYQLRLTALQKRTLDSSHSVQQTTTNVDTFAEMLSSPSKRKRPAFIETSPCRNINGAVILLLLPLLSIIFIQNNSLVSFSERLERLERSNRAIIEPNAKAPATLALLYPPGLLGGYRNQVIRLMALCMHARKKNISQLYLPSLFWSTQLSDSKNVWSAIPMHMVFDISYWNHMAVESGNVLPLLAQNLTDSDCWVKQQPSSSNTSMTPLQRASFEQGYLAPIESIATSFFMGNASAHFQARRLDLLPLVQHCKNPFVHGGGTKSGRLWKEYMAATKHHHDPMDEWVLRALQPAPHWRTLADRCVQEKVQSKSYMALHARVELEMMGHVCGKEMERNLTTILSRSLRLAKEKQSVAGLFLAVSKAGMEEKGPLYDRYKEIADENLSILQKVLEWKEFPVFECGSQMIARYYSEKKEITDHGSLLESVINFYTAVHSSIFIGVKGSSFSNDVWKTRYYLGNGDSNYRYTTNGIELVVGLPEPHKNCKRATKEKL